MKLEHQAAKPDNELQGQAMKDLWPPGRHPPRPYLEDMPVAELTNAHDHFTDLFGTRRGSGRPNEDTPMVLSSQWSPRCSVPVVVG